VKIYWHWWDNTDITESSIILYSKETGFLEYSEHGFFAQYSIKKEIFYSNKGEYFFVYLGEL
tara:strand:+ start:123 stop:308 length:186 start_codon:yes stop_codon:yes gene_type:complete